MTQTKKHLGQHWLHDADTLEAIINSADVAEGDYVLEVGPGLGTLTQLLLDRGAQVHAIEFDADLIDGLQKKFGHHENFQLTHTDILQFPFDSLPVGYKVVANIPYYLTSNLIRLLCESPNHFSRAALLIQKEVAERVCATPGDMSILSVATQFYAVPSLGAIVPAELFTPPPKVDSRVLELDYRQTPLFEDVDTKVFFQLVKAGFSEKRKMMRSSLSGGLGIAKQDVEELLAKAGISPELRAQQLSLSDWYDVYKAYV